MEPLVQIAKHALIHFSTASFTTSLATIIFENVMVITVGTCVPRNNFASAEFCTKFSGASRKTTCIVDISSSGCWTTTLRLNLNLSQNKAH
ncbi:hypothetical protein G4B88_018072 [Cannabis sativa]|uniref:Uncharacterized protein n=1 Tax=Cannabis sativa TaxID=3483 RepID=A0A7J6FQJ0_CANSA|nr:hypothetical protein G4B88_018072 [Cannabis sativa]